jgi:hypothetical protein
MYTWKVFYENADTDDPRCYIGTIQGESAAQSLENAAQFYERPMYDLVIEGPQPASAGEQARPASADEQAFWCAFDQVARDFTSCEVTSAAIFRKIVQEDHRLAPGDAHRGATGDQWYVEVGLKQSADEPEATALYRVWHDADGLRALQIDIR